MRSMENKLENAFQGLAESLPDCIAQKVKQRIRASFVVNGQMHPTLNDMDQRFSLQMENIRSLIQQMIAAHHLAAPAEVRQEHRGEASGEVWWQQFNWNDGQITHFVPLGWRFPRGITVKKLWDLWYYGDRSTGIRPYRLINKKWDINSKDNMMYSRAQTVLNCIHKLIPQSMPSDPVSISKLTLPEADSLFEVTFNHFWALSMTVPLT